MYPACAHDKWHVTSTCILQSSTSFALHPKTKKGGCTKNLLYFKTTFSRISVHTKCGLFDTKGDNVLCCISVYCKNKLGVIPIPLEGTVYSEETFSKISDKAHKRSTLKALSLSVRQHIEMLGVDVGRKPRRKNRTSGTEAEHFLNTERFRARRGYIFSKKPDCTFYNMCCPSSSLHCNPTEDPSRTLILNSLTHSPSLTCPSTSTLPCWKQNKPQQLQWPAHVSQYHKWDRAHRTNCCFISSGTEPVLWWGE